MWVNLKQELHHTQKITFTLPNNSVEFSSGICVPKYDWPTLSLFKELILQDSYFRKSVMNFWPCLS